MGTTASLVLQFRESGLSELRRGLSDLRRESQAAADDARGLTGTLVGASRERIRAMQAEIDAEKRLIEQKKQAQSIINQYNAEMNQRGRNRSSYEDFWTKSLAERERAEKATEDKLLREWLAAKDRRAAEVAAAERVQSDARLRRLREEAAAEKRKNDQIVADTKRAVAEKERAEKEGLQRIAAADRAIRERMRQSASVTTQGGGGSFDMLSKASLWVTGLNQALGLFERLVGVAGSFVQEAAKWESITLALENMEGGARQASTAISHLYEIAKAPGIDLMTAQHAYLKLRAVSISGAEAERVIKGFSNTVARGGGGSVQFGRVLEQFTQMRAENRVLQQDLKFMKNSMPELASLMEKAFGTTTAAGIRKLGINARQFTDGILAEMEKLPKAQQTLTSEIENSITAMSRLKAAFVDTDWTKKFISNITLMMEGATSIIKSESVDWGKFISGAFDNLKNLEISDFVLGGGIIGKLFAGGLKSGAARDERATAYANLDKEFSGSVVDRARYGEYGAKNIGRQRKDASGLDYNARKAALDRFYANLDASVPNDEKIKADQIAKEEREAAAEKAMSEKKAAADKAKRDQEALQKQLEAARIKLDAEAAYQKTLDGLRKKGYSDSEAAIVANTQKELSIISDNLEAQLKKAHGSRKLEEEARKQSEELQINSQLEMNTKLAEIRKKDREDKEKQRLKEMADIRTRLAEIQKAEQEANDKLEALDEAELNRRDALYDSVAESYESEIDLINRHAEEKLAILKASGYKSLELENKINAEREVKATEYYEKQLRAALDGAETLTGSVADVYKTGIDRDYDRKKKAVEKTLSIDGLEGAARLAGKQKLDSALERLEAEHEAKMQGTYKTLFTIQKSFAIASATVQLASAAIKAMAMSGSVWEQLANAGAVMAAGGALVSTISSATYSGMYDKGGYIPRGSYGIAGENGPEIITGPARVTSTRDTARIMSGNSQPVVNVYNNAGVDVETRTNSKGELEVMINKVVEAAESRIASGIGSGSGGVDRALRSTYGLNRGR